LVHRADAAGLMRRVRDTEDRPVVQLLLTDAGSRRLESLTAMHVAELERLC
jgi:DNA-binding MarR family transcriptional regulator